MFSDFLNLSDSSEDMFIHNDNHRNQQLENESDVLLAICSMASDQPLLKKTMTKLLLLPEYKKVSMPGAASLMEYVIPAAALSAY